VKYLPVDHVVCLGDHGDCQCSVLNAQPGLPGPAGERGDPGMTGEFGREGDSGDPGLQGDDGFPVRKIRRMASLRNSFSFLTSFTRSSLPRLTHLCRVLSCHVVLCCRDLLGRMDIQAQKVEKETWLLPKRKVQSLCYFISFLINIADPLTSATYLHTAHTRVWLHVC